MLEKTIKILDKIAELSIYALVFIIPFSKAGIEIFATVAIAAWLIKQITNYKLQITGYFPKTPLNKPILALFALSFISMLFSAHINLSLEGVFLKLSEYLLLFFICADIFSKKDSHILRLKLLLAVLIISVIVLFADAGFQWVTGKDFIRGFIAGGRLKACFSNSSNFAGYIIAILPVLFCMTFLRFKKMSTLPGLVFKLGGMALYLVGLVLLGKTLARGALVACLVSMGFLVLIAGFIIRVEKKWEKRFVLLAVLCVLIPFIIGGAYVESVKERLVSMKTGFAASVSRLYQWKEAVAIIEDFPIFGTGPNTYTLVIPDYSLSKITGCYPHNSYLHIAAENGVLGLSAFLWVILSFFGNGIRAILKFNSQRQKQISSKKQKRPKERDNYRFMLLGIMAGVLAVLAQSFFDTNLFALRQVVLFWIMMGVALSIYKNMGFDTAFKNRI